MIFGQATATEISGLVTNVRRPVLAPMVRQLKSIERRDGWIRWYWNAEGMTPEGGIDCGWSGILDEGQDGMTIGAGTMETRNDSMHYVIIASTPQKPVRKSVLNNPDLSLFD